MITEEEVLHIANLAKLKLSDEETKNFTTQLGEIINYFQQLNELDTSDIAPVFKSIKGANVFREDIVDSSQCLSMQEALKNAPDIEENFLKVPKMKGAD